MQLKPNIKPGKIFSEHFRSLPELVIDRISVHNELLRGIFHTAVVPQIALQHRDQVAVI